MTAHPITAEAATTDAVMADVDRLTRLIATMPRHARLAVVVTLVTENEALFRRIAAEASGKERFLRAAYILSEAADAIAALYPEASHGG